MVPNIVNVTTITGVTSASVVLVTTGPRGDVGITTVVTNPSGSGKVLKINTLVADLSEIQLVLLSTL